MGQPSLRAAAFASLAWVAVSLGASAGCAPDEGVIRLERGGKGDGVVATFELTESSSTLTFAVECEGETACDGEVMIELIDPDPCSFIAVDGCGDGPIEPQDLTLANVTVISEQEGTRDLTLRLETRDGLDFSRSLAAAFTAPPDSTVEVSIDKDPDIDRMTISVGAEWEHIEADFDPAAELEAYLDDLEGVHYEEIGAALSGYRSYRLEIEQPLDHDDPNGIALTQRAILHHRDVDAPMVLHTTGYNLTSTTNLSEVTQMLDGNQISTEQRFFDQSRPEAVQPEHWQQLTIEQAARDHHRVVELLRPFYEQSWISTGHSKGGMTSVYHQRFFPDDVEATLAYVAPISFDYGDPRYSAFLDTIGSEDCRESFEALQRQALERADELLEHSADRHSQLTFERFDGGRESAFELSVTAMGWGYWQRRTAWRSCPPEVAEDADIEELDEVLFEHTRLLSDASVRPLIVPYYYQAMAQLGIQRFGAAELDPLRRFDRIVFDKTPEDVPAPQHDPAAMQDIQDWVIGDADDIVFLYGEWDPWTGGAFDVGDNPALLKVVAPEADHGALVADLEDEDRRRVLDRLEELVGVPFDPDVPLVAPRPAVVTVPGLP